MEGDGEARSMIAREVAIGARIQSPHAVRVLPCVGDTAGITVMEHVEGLSLAELIARGQANSDLSRLLVPVVVDALLGLSAMHKLSGASDGSPAIVHQAPVPRHVLVGLDGVGRLCDFTQCVGAGFPWSQRLVDRLRPHELSPEHALAPAHVDARCDVFIAGGTLWHALTGRTLFGDASSEEAVQRMLRMPIPSLRDAGMPSAARLDRLLFRALARARAERLATAEEFAEELRCAAQSAGLFAERDEVAALVKNLREARMLPSAMGAGAQPGRALPTSRPAPAEVQRTLIGYAAHPGAGRADPKDESGVWNGGFVAPTGAAAPQAQAARYAQDDDTTFRIQAQQAAAEVADVVAQLVPAEQSPQVGEAAYRSPWADLYAAPPDATPISWAPQPQVPVAEPFPVRYPVATADAPDAWPESRRMSVDATDYDNLDHRGRRRVRRGALGRFVRLVGISAVTVVGSGLLVRAMLPDEDRAAASEFGAMLGDRATSLVQELGPMPSVSEEALGSAPELAAQGVEPHAQMAETRVLEAAEVRGEAPTTAPGFGVDDLVAPSLAPAAQGGESAASEEDSVAVRDGAEPPPSLLPAAQNNLELPPAHAVQARAPAAQRMEQPTAPAPNAPSDVKAPARAEADGVGAAVGQETLPTNPY
jgi:hypothetical protein